MKEAQRLTIDVLAGPRYIENRSGKPVYNTDLGYLMTEEPNMSRRRLPPKRSWRDPLFETSHQSDLTEMWDRVQRTQVDLGFAQELVAYYSADTWMEAKSVLDLGTGNGYYLRKLASYFPDKTYCGIDSSQELIAIAESETTVPNISFRYCDLFDAGGQYDFVIMRLLLQHIQDVSRALAKVAEMTRPGGSALIMDPYLPARLFRPEAPELTKFLAAYKAQQAEQGLDREIAAHLDAEIDSNPKWRLADRMVLINPSTFPGTLEIFQETIYLMVKIIETTGAMRYDFDRVRREWDWWCSVENAYVQVGLAVFRLDRVTP